MFIETRSQRAFKARSVNQTSNGYVSKIATGTTPNGDAGTATGASIITLCHEGITGVSGAVILPYGVGSNNNTFSMRVIGWDRIGNDPNTLLWVPVMLLEVQVTLSSSCVGVAGREVVATELFADTIALVGTSGNPNVSCEIISPANDTIAHLTLTFKGFAKAELSFTTGASATSCNALVMLS